jgi:Ser/Thr protein kinase RdoA (MazF antagonist)
MKKTAWPIGQCANYGKNEPMKPFEQLTWPGKQRRFRRLAEDALRYYPFEIQQAKLFSYDTNLLYRVRTVGGETYVLRLANDRWRTPSNAAGEVSWLDALAAETTVPVPRIIRTTDGSTIVTPTAEGAPDGFHALLMSWLPGTLLGKRLTAENLAKMGELFGQLHRHAGHWQPPADFPAQRFDRMIARGEPDLLLSEQALALYPPGVAEGIQQMVDAVAAAYAALDPADLRVIHCDLWHDNIKVHRGVLYPFDFEDTIWGYRLHDIAMAMLDLYEGMDQPRYEQLLTVFRTGYERYLPWPEGPIELLQIGRMLWRTNHFAHHVDRFGTAWVAKDAAFNVALYQRYLATGKLIPPLRTPRD